MAVVTTGPAALAAQKRSAPTTADGRPRPAPGREERPAPTQQTAAPPVPIRRRVSSLVIERQLIERIARLRGCGIETIEAERDSSDGPLPVEQEALALALCSVAALHGIALSPHDPAVTSVSYYLEDATAMLSEQLGVRVPGRRKG